MSAGSINTAGHIGIAGAGLAGRMLAERLSRTGWDVTLVDPDPVGTESCAHVGAGMLAPWCEREHSEPLITQLGLMALDLWPDILSHLSKPVYFQHKGSLVVAHPNDRRELDRLADMVQRTTR